MEQVFQNLALNGGQVILYFLVILSMLSIGVMIERGLYFFQNREDTVDLIDNITTKLGKKEYSEAIEILKDKKSPTKRVLHAGLSNLDRGTPAVEEIFSSHILMERLKMERLVAILGTIGNNAPFIGLLGTILGIFKTFNDLAVLNTQGPSAVMAGISQALIATAVGLFVAIPAVIAFNFFQRKIKTHHYIMESSSKIIMSFLLHITCEDTTI